VIPPAQGHQPTLLEVLEGAISHGSGAFAGVLQDAIYRGIDSIMAGVASRGAPPRSGPPPRSGTAPRSAPRSPPPPPSPARELAQARAVMGFDLDQKLTLQDVAERRRELARIFHPDRKGGSVERMQRINNAADVLERALAKGA
jgi:hypothetical protein